MNRLFSDVAQQSDLVEQVFETMSDAVAVFDADARCVLLNERARRLVRVSSQQRDVSRVFDTLGLRCCYADGSPCPRNELPVARTLRGESFDNLDLVAETSVHSGRIRLCASGRPFWNPDGTRQGGFVVFRDVTEERRREEQLQEVTKTLRAQKQTMEIVVDSISDGVVAADEHGRFTIFNSSAERIVGKGKVDSGPDDWSAEYGLYLSDRTTPFPADQLPLVRALRGESSDAVEMFVRNRDNADGAFLSVSGRPLRYPDQTTAGAVVVFHDVTEIKKSEEKLRQANDELREQNRFMETVFESISDGVVVADSSGRLTMANTSAKRMVGMDITNAPSDDWSTIYGTFHPDEVTPFPSEQLPLVRAINGESSNDIELFIRNPHVPDGVHISVSGRSMLSGGEHSGGVIVFRDVTSRIRTQEALLKAFDSGRLEVIETVLHNIGNAINSVATGVETIRERVGNNELVCRFVALAEAVEPHREDWVDWLSSDPQGRNVRNFLLALVSDLVTWNNSLCRTAERASARVRHIVDIIRAQDARGIGADRKLVELRQVIADSVRGLGGMLAKRGITIEVDTTRAPVKIGVRENQLAQVLINLLKNGMEAIEAVRPTGGAVEPDADQDRRIRVCAYRREGSLVIDVIDDGIGIAPEQVRDIFMAGYTTKAQGKGLGLYSAALFATDTGGRIEALSEGVGRGTTMRVTVPLSSLRQESLPYQQS